MHPSLRRVLATVVALLLVAGVAAATSTRSTEPEAIRPRASAPPRPSAVCADVRRFGADAQLRDELTRGCRAEKGPFQRRATAGAGPEAIVYTHAAADRPPTVIDELTSVIEHHHELLGLPSPRAVAVLPVDIAGPIRGRAGRGYLLLDEPELRNPTDCELFRASAGVEGRCGLWVLAHEAGHQWFRWTAFRTPVPFWPAVIEGTSDYLALDWWRSEFGSADAELLAKELIDGRLGLARSFATTNVPARPPAGMDDREQRALVYGRATGAWIAIEQAIGIPATHRLLRAVFDAGRQAAPTLEEVFAAAGAADVRGAAILRTWWTDTEFSPRLGL